MSSVQEDHDKRPHSRRVFINNIDSYQCGNFAKVCYVTDGKFIQDTNSERRKLILRMQTLQMLDPFI